MIYVSRLTIIIVSPNTIILNDNFLIINQKSHFFPAIAHGHIFYPLCIKFMNKLVYYNVDF